MSQSEESSRSELEGGAVKADSSDRGTGAPATGTAPPVTLTSLTAHRITEPWQVERMRQIYNETLPDLATRPGLTPRTEAAQQEWWSEVHDHAVAHLYSPITEPWKFVAFSLVQWKPGGIVTPLFAIETAWQGRGLGRQIIDHYLKIANAPLAGSALTSNRAIMHLNERAGWQQLAERDGVALLYHPGPHPTDDARQREIFDAIMEYHGL